MSSREAQMNAFGRLLDIMDELREKCPWDQKQTMESLRHLTLEESYELADAIVENQAEEIKKELGDLMLHLVFYARIASESGAFDVGDVLDGICEKLIFRHPHIYGNVKVANEEEVKANWEKLKLKEGKKSVLEGVPKALPAMVKAIRIQDKARGIGFDWAQKSEVWAKVEEELAEFKEAEAQDDRVEMEKEFGDYLFALINYARFLQIDPELALSRTNSKFIKRFRFMEDAIAEEGKVFSELSLNEMDVYWNQAKLLGY